jgi:hypothetical protein
VKDVAKLFQSEFNDACVTLIESQQILGSFDAHLRSYAEKKIKERKRFNLIQSSVVGWSSMK